MDYLNTIQFETYIAACAKNGGVTVKWDDPRSTPRTDGKTMYIPSVTSKTSEEWLARIRYYVKHETSHIAYTNFKYLNTVRPAGLLALINNLLEDHRIDFINDMQYLGDRKISDDYWVLMHNDIKSRLLSSDAKLSEQQQLTLPLFAWEAGVRSWVSSADMVCHQLRGMLDTSNAAKYDKLCTYSDRLVSIREAAGDQSEAVYKLACDILRDVFEADPEKHKEPELSKAEGGSGGKDAKGEGDGEGRIDVSKLMESMGHEHKEHKRKMRGAEHEIGSGAYSIPAIKDYKILRFPALHSCVTHHSVGHLNKHIVREYITNNAKPMANKLRIKLQTRSRDRYEYGLKKGKLHTGSVHRLTLGDVPNAERVFRQKKVNVTLDTAVCLLVDCSGSMSGIKFNMACCAAGAFSAALKPLNITHSVLGFTNTLDEEDPIVWVFSDYNERVSSDDLVDRFHRASACLWENTDGDAIAYAAATLAARKEQRKVLLVLSDGEPAGRLLHGDIRRYTKDVIERIEKSNIDIYGVGLLDKSVKRFYTNHVIVDSVDELTPTILKLLDRSI